MKKTQAQNKIIFSSLGKYFIFYFKIDSRSNKHVNFKYLQLFGFLLLYMEKNGG